MKKIDRREFIASSIRNTAAVSISMAALGGSSRRVLGANDKVVLGIIGAGSRGSNVLLNMVKKIPHVEVKYICDVNQFKGVSLGEELKSLQGYAPKREIEMRKVFADKEVDAVLVATPEHWHALASVWACQAGKDVYVEKCHSLSVFEGRKVIEAAEKYKRIVQVGTQNRSGEYARLGAEYIKSGKLGKVLYVHSYNMMNKQGRQKKQSDEPVPKELDWDRWLGPAPWVPYNPGRMSLQGGRGWQEHWDYCGGVLSDDGSHVLDLMRLVMGDPPHPKSVHCQGGRYLYDDGREIPDFQEVTWDFGEWVATMTCSEFTPYMKKCSQDVRYGKIWPWWPTNSTRTEIYGTEGVMYSGRHGCGWQVFVEEPDDRSACKPKLLTEFKGYFPDDAHQKNWIECIKNRKKPNGDPVQGHLSACLVHLGNIAYRTGNKKLYFDGSAEAFVQDPEANSLLSRPYRGEYRVPDAV
jgi:predicted dehydrogenase